MSDIAPRSLLSSILPALGVAVTGFFLAKGLFRKSPSAPNSHPLPPGPKRKPVIGNLLDLPMKDQWLRVTEWEKEFGNIIYLNVAGNHIIFVNDQPTAAGILEKRTSISSDRAITSMVDLMGAERIFAFMRYGSTWRTRRRIFHQEINSTTTHNHMDVQLKYTRALMVNLRDDPSEFDQHYKYFSAAIILDLMYGFDIKPIGDPYVKVAEDGLNFVKGLISGTYLVDAFPFLKSLPDWIPDPGFIGTRAAKLYGRQLGDFSERPFKESSESFEAGTARPSFVRSWLRKLQTELPEGEAKHVMTLAIQDVAASAFAGGFETTSAALLNLTLAMILHPEVQSKAQEELDRVIGRSRVPDFSDRENLPYMNALVSEILRWFPITPLGVPHKLSTSSEEVYKGMRFPAGSIIIPNVWGMSRNVKEYGPDVEAFRPERFLNTNAMDPRTYLFGFGRRICPGRHLGENSIFITTCYMLHLFAFARAKGEDGKEIPTNHQWVSGLTTHLEPFPCSIRPRFEGAEKLINSYCAV